MTLQTDTYSNFIYLLSFFCVLYVMVSKKVTWLYDMMIPGSIEVLSGYVGFLLETTKLGRGVHY